jgi:hypothetical protein
VILFVVYRQACMCCPAYIRTIAKLPFDHPTEPIGSRLLSRSLAIFLLEQSTRQVSVDTSLSPQNTINSNEQTCHRSIRHQPSDTTNGPPPPPRLNHASDGNADNNANDLLHLHHHTPLHHRLETHNPIPLRLDLPLSRPPLHSLPRSASSKMQFASLLASSRPSREEKGSGAGTVVLCGRRR